MRIWICCLLLGSIVLQAPLPAQTPLPPANAEPDQEAEIQVEGLAKPQDATLDQFREAQQAFEKYRESLAPSAPLLFELLPSNKQGITTESLDTVKLALVGEEDRIPITIGANHRFTMPDLAPLKGKYKLFANVGKKPIIVVPHIYSPGTSKEDRRLGDLLLECQTFWGFYKSEVPFILRPAFAMVGGCRSKKISIMTRMAGPIASVRVSDKGKTKDIALNPKFPLSYRQPLYDKSLSNEARVTITYK